MYCDRHGGRADEGDAPRADPRFASAVAELVGMTEEEFARRGDVIDWLDRNQPDADDLAFDRAVLAEASRLREKGASR